MAKVMYFPPDSMSRNYDKSSFYIGIWLKDLKREVIVQEYNSTAF